MNHNPKHDDWTLQWAVNVAKSKIKKSGSFASCIVSFSNKSKKAFVVPFQNANPEQKERFYAAMKLFHLLNKVDHYVVLLEAWGSKNNERPSEDPNRDDLIMVLSVNSERVRSYTFKKVMGEGGGGVSLEQINSGEGGTGNLVDLLPPKELENAPLPFTESQVKAFLDLFEVQEFKPEEYH